MQLRLVNTLFAAYFENEQDPGSPELLSKLSTEAGVFPSEEAARTFLSSNEGIAEVQRAFREASLVKGISGVPHFELTAETGKAYSEEKTYEIPGAQESETMVAVIERLAQEVKGKMANGGNATAAAPGARC